MRIISKFHDYYDVHQDYSDTLIFKRQESCLENLPINTDGITPVKKIWNDGPNEYQLFMVAFCGEIHLGMKVFEHKWEGLRFTITEYITYDVDEIKAIGERLVWRFDEWFEHIQRTDYSQVFIDNKLPVVLIEKYGGGVVFTVNPNLSDIKFYRVKDSWTAYNEIDQFVLRYMLPEPDTIDVPDDVMAQKKGFGRKYDFRKPPQK